MKTYLRFYSKEQTFFNRIKQENHYLITVPAEYTTEEDVSKLIDMYEYFLAENDCACPNVFYTFTATDLHKHFYTLAPNDKQFFISFPTDGLHKANLMKSMNTYFHGDQFFADFIETLHAPQKESNN